MSGLDDIKTLISAGPAAPAAGGNAAVAHFLGVPDGYSMPHQGVGSNMNPNVNGGSAGTPKYVEGTETYLGASWSPEKRAEIQQQMDQAGLYGSSGSYRLGLWDDDSQKAFSSVLSYANQNGLDYNDALYELKANPLKKPDAIKPVKPGAVTQLTPAVTLEQSIQQSAQQRLGRRLRSSEVARFVTVYHGLEHGDNASQTAAQDAAQATPGQQGVPGTDGASTELMPNAPAPGAAADGFIDSQYGQEAAGQSVAGYYDVIKNLIGGQ